jgi:hypothetical protein
LNISQILTRGAGKWITRPRIALIAGEELAGWAAQ